MRFPFAITLLLLAARIAAGDVAIPPLRQHVTDLTGTLSPAQHQRNTSAWNNPSCPSRRTRVPRLPC